MVLADIGDHSGALTWFRKAIEMDRYFILAYLNAGKALHKVRFTRVFSNDMNLPSLLI